jgi:transposase
MTTLANTLRRRQQCHDLRAQGLSSAAIHRILLADGPVGATTAKTWLRQPRPTEADIAAAAAKDARPPVDTTGQVPLKMRFPPDLMAAMKAEAEAQGGAPLNKLIGCSLRLYLDCMTRARNGSQEPVQVLGYRA